MCDQLPLPETPHDWMRDSKEVLGERFIFKTYGINSSSHLYRWFRDPYSEAQNDASRSPLERLRLHIAELVAAGRADFAQATINMLQAAIPKKNVRPDKFTLEEELLDSYPRLVAFHQAIREKRSPVLTRNLCEKAKDDLEEDQVMWEETHRAMMELAEEQGVMTKVARKVSVA